MVPLMSQLFTFAREAELLFLLCLVSYGRSSIFGDWDAVC